MLYRQLALAATAAAFLVVPEASETDREIVSTLPLPLDLVNADAEHTSLWHPLSLPCWSCEGENAQVQMDFSIEDGTRLTLNGFELYPKADPWHDDLTATVKADGENKEQTLGYGLFVKPEISDTEGHLSLIPIDIQILEVGGVFVKDMSKIKVKLVKAPSGLIIIGNVDLEEPYHNADGPTASPLWTIKEKVEEFFKKLRSGCGRHRQHENGEGRTHKYEGKHGYRPYRHDFPHAHRHGHHRHHWGRLLKNIALNIVLPVLAGITAGMGVALLTMGLCSCFALVFRARRRRSHRAIRRCARRSKAAASEPALVEEKAGLMEAEDDAPPQYEDDREAK